MVLQRCLFAEDRWQIYDTSNNGRVLVAEAGFANQWLADGLLTRTEVDGFAYGSQRFVLVLGGRNYRLEPVDETETPDDFTDCQAFVAAVAETRKLLPDRKSTRLNPATNAHLVCRILLEKTTT